MFAVCSNKPRPSVQNNYHPKGNQGWVKDAWHLAESMERTLCGRKASDWLKLDEIPPLDDFHACALCVAKVKR